MGRRKSVPSYRKKGPYAVTTLADAVTGRRRDFMLGAYGAPGSRERYARLIAEWEAAGRRLPGGAAVGNDRGATISAVCAAYLAHVDGKISRKEFALIRDAVQALCDLYGSTPASAFGAGGLRAVQDSVRSRWSPGSTNRAMGRIRGAFRWGVGEGLVPAGVITALTSVRPLRNTQERVMPVDIDRIDAVLPLVTPQIGAMIQLQRLTGMRPGEVCGLRWLDIDATGTVWLYTPASHKTAYMGRTRIIYIGPRGQTILSKFHKGADDAPLFTPRRPGSGYTVSAYGLAIRRACDSAGVLRWSPNQLRHTYATEVRRLYGLEAAQVLLGHSSAQITEAVYAERDSAKGMKIISEIG